MEPDLPPEDFAGEHAVVILPVGTILHHGTDGNWDPATSQIRGPAWFGDEDMASSYNLVMGHDLPTVLVYETVRPLRLLDVSAGTPAGAELAAMWNDEVVPSDMAHACEAAGYEGWFETGGEVMICDGDDVRLQADQPSDRGSRPPSDAIRTFPAIPGHEDATFRSTSGDMPVTETTQSKYLTPIRKGEYDIANISIIGHDPKDGRSYEECHAEWQRAFDGLLARSDATRWWQLWQKLRIRWQTMALATHLGMH